MSTTLRVGFVGFGLREITSIGRTARLYIDSLRASSSFDVVDVEDNPRESIDIILDFGHTLIQSAEWPAVPVACCMHGTVARGLGPYADRLDEIRPSATFVVNCHGDADILHSFGVASESIAVLPLAVSERIGPKEAARLDLPSSAVVFGFVGRLLPQRNLHRVLHALAALRKKGVAASLAVVGTVQRYEYLDWYSTEAYATCLKETLRSFGLQESVRFLGELTSDSLLSEFYSRIDCLVHPSTIVDENFGYVPREAAACGTPAITTNWGGLKDWNLSGASYPLRCRSTATGVRIRQADLEFAMEEMADPIQRERLAIQARRTATERLGRARFQNELEHILQDAYRRSERPHRQARPAPESSTALNRNPVDEPIWDPVHQDWLSLWAHLRDYGDGPEPIDDHRVLEYAFGFDDGLQLSCRDPAWPSDPRGTQALPEILLREMPVGTRASVYELTAGLSRSFAHPAEVINRLVNLDGVLHATCS